MGRADQAVLGTRFSLSEENQAQGCAWLALLEPYGLSLLPASALYIRLGPTWMDRETSLKAHCPSSLAAVILRQTLE